MQDFFMSGPKNLKMHKNTTFWGEKKIVIKMVKIIQLPAKQKK